MDAEFNRTYIILGGYVGVDKYGYLYFVILLALYLLILCTNLTIICVICIHRNLHEPMYIFIAALSVNSILMSATIYPKLFIDVLSRRQIISHSACMFQYFIFYSIGISDILLLSAMAYDRYVSICKPLQYSIIMGRITVTVLLALAWFIPALQVAVAIVVNSKQKLCDFTTDGFFCNNKIFRLYCVQSTFLKVYPMFILLNVIIVPAIFIIFTYIKIFLIAYHSCPEVRKKATETCLPHLIILMCCFFLCIFDVISARMQSDLPNGVNLIMSLQIVMYGPLFNPIIYGVKMKEISKHIKRLLCHFWTKNK
uniref:olfactory receptor 10J4-like n=1 Tax=Doryrhamphus excisus TaxID=161450 RepID=UPI0025AE37B4|nr:olfactory receptor 10J4-like [Doryrhamphus excisus]